MKAYLSAMFRAELRDLKKGGYRTLGRRYGLSHVTFNTLLNRGTGGGGPAMQKAYARIHFANSMDRFNEAVEQWSEKEGFEEPEATPTWRKVAPRFPRMTPALEMGLDAGLERVFLEHFAAEEHQGADDNETDAATWWIRLQGAWSTRRAGGKDAVEAAEDAKDRERHHSERSPRPRRR